MSTVAEHPSIAPHILGAMLRAADLHDLAEALETTTLDAMIVEPSALGLIDGAGADAPCEGCTDPRATDGPSPIDAVAFLSYRTSPTGRIDRIPVGPCCVATLLGDDRPAGFEVWIEIPLAKAEYLAVTA